MVYKTSFKYNDCLPRGMKGRVINLSGKNLELSQHIRDYRRLIILPDYSPNKGLPTGSVAIFDKKNHRINPEFLGQDIGCGMLLAKFDSKPIDLEDCTNKLARALMSHDKGLGSLGGGNHFITIYEVIESQKHQIQPIQPSQPISDLSNGVYVVLIHSGNDGNYGGDNQRELSLSYGKERDNVDNGFFFEKQRVAITYAEDNRKELLKIVIASFGVNAQIMFDRTHNFFEKTEAGFIYRKGAAKVMPDNSAVIVSSMGGDGVLVMANERVPEIEYSLPHATGRRISRSEGKKQDFFLDGFPKNIYFPYFLDVEHYNEELPPNYKQLDDVLNKMKEYVTVTAKLTPRSSMMM